MNRSRVKSDVLFFYFFHFSYFPVAQGCVLLGPAAGREWATQKLVGVLAAADEQDTAGKQTEPRGDSHGLRLPYSYSC
jgi:hypothetical protein